MRTKLTSDALVRDNGDRLALLTDHVRHQLDASSPLSSGVRAPDIEFDQATATRCDASNA